MLSGFRDNQPLLLNPRSHSTWVSLQYYALFHNHWEDSSDRNITACPQRAYVQLQSQVNFSESPAVITGRQTAYSPLQEPTATESSGLGGVSLLRVTTRVFLGFPGASHSRFQKSQTISGTDTKQALNPSESWFHREANQSSEQGYPLPSVTHNSRIWTQLSRNPRPVDGLCWCALPALVIFLLTPPAPSKNPNPNFPSELCQLPPGLIFAHFQSPFIHHSIGNELLLMASHMSA